ncbi:MAG: replicative DNA helicase [Clostridiales bacterium]|nr:replicative DNA helicase [Eubacterium sp.]MDD5994971.1 replicative DNA helicase [Clostridiales bacterium]MDD7349513.1 replicative DNA helicase [Clostridiales bacterium]MDY3773832.1 replicative DNA helicase [Eubacterium sp.]
MEEQIIKKILPHSTEAEQSVIGAMIMDQEAILTASEILVADDFYNPQFRTLYDAMLGLYQEGKPVDLVTLQNRLQEMNVPAELCSVEFISNIIAAVPTSANVKYYSEIVREKSVLRRLIRVSEGIANECYQDNEKLEDTLEKAEKQIFDVVQNRASSDFVPIRQVALETLESIQSAAKNVGAVTGVSTGFYDLDARTAGLQKSDLILIAARPSMGKTAFVLNIAENVAIKNNITTVIFSLEMSRVQLAKRLISMNSHVDSQKIRTGQLEDSEWRDLTESTVTLGESALVIDDTPGISIGELRSKCRKLKIEKDLGLIIIDYLQLMSGSGNHKNESRQQEISDISRALKALAREVDCPVIALSQLSRAVEKRDDKRPMLSDLRESGAIEQDADVVMFIYRDEYYNKDSDSKGITEIIIGKQRNGPTCTVQLKWLAELTKFANLEMRS